MTRAEREADPGESFDGGYHLYAKEKQKLKVRLNVHTKRTFSNEALR